MKPSECIQLALETNYGSYSTMMCQCIWHLIKDANDRYATTDVIASMVDSIYDYGWSLHLALYKTHEAYFQMNQKQQFLFRKQLYIWFVFDLKRKGL